MVIKYCRSLVPWDLRSISIVPSFSFFIHSRRLQEHPSSNASNHELLVTPLLGTAHSFRYFVYFILGSFHDAHYANSTVNIGPPTPHSTSLQGFRCVTVKQCFFAPFLRVFALRGGLTPSFSPCLSPGIFPFSSPPANDWSRRGYFDVFITSAVASGPLDLREKPASRIAWPQLILYRGSLFL